MNSQTTRKPDQQRPARSSKSAKPRKYIRQTAHVEARRDGTPLIFGWGGHLSRSEKTRIQRRAVLSLAILIIAGMIGVLVFSWINITVITPNLPISSVNGQNIPQSDYHKLVVFKAQVELNKLKALQNQSSSLSAQIAKEQSTIDTDTTNITKYTDQLKTATGDQKTTIQNQLDAATADQTAMQKKHDSDNTQYQNLQSTGIPNEQARYTQSQLSGETANWLQEDILIRNWVAKQSSAIQNQINPSNRQLNSALQTFRKAIPSGNNILYTNGLNDNDISTMMALQLRRDNMNAYLGKQYVSPMRQVQVNSLTAATQKDAATISKQLQGKSLADFETLAKSKSQDANTKSKGGELGWLVVGQYTNDYSDKLSGTIDNWIFDPARKVGDVSPVLTSNGSYYVIRIDDIQASRDVDAATLAKMKNSSTPIDVWIQSQRSLPGMNITTPDQNKLLDTNNMPQSIPYSYSPTPTPSAGA